MEKVELLKKIDKFLGTPICYLLAAFDQFVFRKDEAALTGRRILVMKLVAIGDLVVCLPTLRALRKSFPSSHIAMLVTPRVREVVEGCSFLDEVVYYDVLNKDRGAGGLFRIIREIRKRRFDLVIELDHYYRITTLISYLAGIRNRVGFDLPGQGRRDLCRIRVPYLMDAHEVEAFLEAARQIGADTSEKDLAEVWVSPEDREQVSRFLMNERVTEKDFLVGIHPGTSSSAISRRWASEKFASVADWLIKEQDAKVILTGAPSEVQLINRTVSFMTSSPIIAAGKTNLKQLAEIARRCRLFISVDTGPLHIAAAMRTRVIGLFGPNTPLKWGPYGNGHVAIYKGLHCSPCTKQYLGQVSKCKDPICMEKITVEDVKQAVLQILRR
ncbi:MAG: glycosyltransferase family 9 protein [Candidatus Zixiibacteriota bacterium]|nr:MAG: glycosyltransferase family 9 protein [candidate division Zixibacteria bacterium]